MDIPSDVIEAVRHKEQEQLSLGLEKRTFVKESSKRIVVEVKRGLRSVGAVAKSLNMSRPNAHSAMKTLEEKGYLVSKKAPSGERKYYLSTNTELIASLRLEKLRTRARKPKTAVAIVPKKKARKPRTTVIKAVIEAPTRKPETQTKESLAYVSALERDVVFKTERISQLELSLSEKEKEVWTLECEVFDKKAIIKYLEERLFALGVK